MIAVEFFHAWVPATHSLEVYGAGFYSGSFSCRVPWFPWFSPLGKLVFWAGTVSSLGRSVFFSQRHEPTPHKTFHIMDGCHI